MTSSPATMRAVRLSAPGPVDNLRLLTLPLPPERDGWVRNRMDGTVEALVAGDAAAVEELLRLCRRGPRMAAVVSIDEEMADPPDDPGFHQVPMA